jgi:hypothetical protein
MIYAYRRHRDQHGRRTVDLFCSETGRPAPAGYTRCSWARFRRAWQISDALTCRQARRRRPLIMPTLGGRG